jgi:hypothetical protein
MVDPASQPAPSQRSQRAASQSVSAHPAMTIVRMQFPLTLCYAITAHKAQGQTLSKVLIDQRHDSFSHGQTYVAFGRAQNRSSVCVLVRPERKLEHHGEEHVLVRNVTFPRLLS